MRQLLRLFVRLVVIVLAFCAAMVMASIADFYLSGWMKTEAAGKLTQGALTPELTIAVLGYAGLLGRYFLLPAGLLIGLGEIAKLRGWLTHALVGAGLAGAGMLVYGLAQSSTLDAVPRLAGAIAAGIVAGLTYWLVAGRNAGRWLPSEREMRESEAEET